MAKLSAQRAYLEIEGKRYGPATCHLEEEAGVFGPQDKHGWGGTVRFDEDAIELPPTFDKDDVLLVIRDEQQRERKIPVLLRQWGIGSEVAFVGRGELE